MSFPITRNEFQNLYGKRVYAITLYLEKSYQKLAKINHHIIFLKQCKKEGVIPHGMHLNHTTNTNKNKKLIDDTMIKMRNNTLNWRFKQKRNIINEINIQEQILDHYMKQINPQRYHQNDLMWINKHDKNMKEKLEEKRQKKLNELIDERNKFTRITPTNNIHTNNVINKSNAQLTEAQLQVLSKGLKFAITPNSINIIDLITKTEASLNTTPNNIKQQAISEINTFIKHWKRPKNGNLNIEEQEALKELKNMNDITITQADKGGKIVVMNKEEYIKKIEEKLSIRLQSFDTLKHNLITIFKIQV